MKTLCEIGLIALVMPWVIGICICLWNYFSEIWDKSARYVELTRLIWKIRRLLKQSDDNKAVRLAFLIEAKHQRSQIFSKDDLKIWKAFI